MRRAWPRLRPLEQRCTRRVANNAAPDARLDEYWLLEELRVSFFA
jgi:hypothetical protein